MGLFNREKLAPGMYHAPSNAEDWALQPLPTETIETLANDPNCVEQEKCRLYLIARLELVEKKAAERRAHNEALQQAKLVRKLALEENPFDTRTEVSADAIHIASKIVTALWLIAVVLPIACGILLALFTPSHY